MAVGGLGSIRGPFVAALLLGIADTGFKYLLPEFGAFFIYALTMAILLWRPQRPVRPRMTARTPPRSSRSTPLRGAIATTRSKRCRGWRRLPPISCFPSYLPLGAQILATILFALSADLVLGYAGIVTLGHAAFFGIGAYTAGILAAHGWGEPITGLLAGAAAAALLGFVSGLIVLRTTGLTLLMQTLVVATLLYEAANKASLASPAAMMGCRAWRCGRSSASSASICSAAPATSIAWPCCSSCWLVGAAHRPFAVRPLADRHPRECPRACTRSARRSARRRLDRSTRSRRRWPGIAGALIAQTTQFVGLSFLGLERSGHAS